MISHLRAKARLSVGYADLSNPDTLANMVEMANSILYVGTPGVNNNSRERALVASGIGVASVESPESAVSYVKNSDVRVVLLEDEGTLNLPLLASCLKIANPFVRVIALMSEQHGAPYVDMHLKKPVSIEILVSAIRLNMALSKRPGLA